MHLLKVNLRRSLPNAKVSVERCVFSFKDLLVIYGIFLEEPNLYSLKIEKLGISGFLQKPFLLKIYLKDVDLILKNFSYLLRSQKDLVRSKNKMPPFFPLKGLEILHFKFKLKDNLLRAKGEASLSLNLNYPYLDYLNLDLESLHTQGLSLKNGYLKLAKEPWGGKIFLKDLSYEKLRIENISTDLSFKERQVLFENFKGYLLGGSFLGKLILTLDKETAYSLSLEFFDLEGERLVKDFSLKDNFLLSGRWQGNLSLAGVGLRISNFAGNLQPKGLGSLTIVKRDFLEGLAKRSALAYEVLAERFNGYRYHDGGLKLSLEDNNLICDLSLEGEKGKSNLKIYLHDFFDILLNIFKPPSGKGR